MVDLPLTRSREGRRRFDLEGFGSLQWQGWFGDSVDLRTRDGRAIRAHRIGARKAAAEATDTAGSVVGDYRREKFFGCSGDVRWGSQTYYLRPERVLSSRFVLERLGQTTMRVRVRGWGRTRAYVTIEEAGADPGLVLFVLYLGMSIVADRSSGGG